MVVISSLTKMFGFCFLFSIEHYKLFVLGKHIFNESIIAHFRYCLNSSVMATLFDIRLFLLRVSIYVFIMKNLVVKMKRKENVGKSGLVCT
jgi:hypothetical protein